MQIPLANTAKRDCQYKAAFRIICIHKHIKLEGQVGYITIWFITVISNWQH